MMGTICNCILGVVDPNQCKFCTRNGGLGLINGEWPHTDLYVGSELIEERERMTFKEIITEIKNLIKHKFYEDNFVQIECFTDGIVCVSLFETRVPINIDIKNDKVYIDTELLNGIGWLDTQMIESISRVSKFLEENIEEFKV